MFFSIFQNLPLLPVFVQQSNHISFIIVLCVHICHPSSMLLLMVKHSVVLPLFSFGLVCLTSVFPSFLPHLSDIVRLTNTIDCCLFLVSLRARSSNEHELIEKERIIMYASEQMNECVI
jgi:hypothetical protein